jgi:hypothetical protein
MPDGSIADLKIEKSSLVPDVDKDALDIVRSGAPFPRSLKGEIQAYLVTFPFVDITGVPLPQSFVVPIKVKPQNLMNESS